MPVAPAATGQPEAAAGTANQQAAPATGEQAQPHQSTGMMINQVLGMLVLLVASARFAGSGGWSESFEEYIYSARSWGRSWVSWAKSLMPASTPAKEEAADSTPSADAPAEGATEEQQATPAAAADATPAAAPEAAAEPAAEPAAAVAAEADAPSPPAAADAAAQAEPPAAPEVSATPPNAGEAALQAAGALATAERHRAEEVERREAALSALREATASRDAGLIQAALRGAVDASLGACPEVLAAEDVLADPGLVLEGLSGETLRERYIELAHDLASSRFHGRAEIEVELASRLEAAEAQCFDRLRQRLDVLQKSRAEEEKATILSFAQKLQQRTLDAVAAAKEAAEEAANEAVTAERAAWKSATEDMVLTQRTARAEEASIVERALAQSHLSDAILAFEQALLAGRDAPAAFEVLRATARDVDGMSARLLAELPEDCVREGPVPTEAVLRQHFTAQLRDLVAAAFTPPGGGLLAEIVARLFSSIYILSAPPLRPELLPMEEHAEVAANLQALSRAAVVAPGDFEASLRDLEASLQGRCREQAGVWFEEAHRALLLRQTLSAVRARAQCLSAALLPQ